MGTSSFRKDGGLNITESTTESVNELVVERRRSCGSRISCDSVSTSKKTSSNSPRLSILGWPINSNSNKGVVSKSGLKNEGFVDDGSHFKKLDLNISEIELMKDRFAKLLLGEDMSGSGKGVCSASAISNAITNLCATLFGQLWRLEPLQAERKSMWRREMEWLLSVGDHIVELIPTWQTFPDGKKLEVMTCRPRTDIFINLPALCKLDNMLIEILDSFNKNEFWYVDQGIVASECDGSSSFRKSSHRQEEKWWLPVPRVPAGGLKESSRKQLDHKRECTNQILKAALSINSMVLSEMDVPESYLESLPKNGRACLGDMMYRYITSDHYAPESLLDILDLSTEHVALEIANRVEAAIYVWRRRLHAKPVSSNPTRSTTKSSWEMMKDLMVDGDKRELLAERAERLLLCLKQRFPGLTQTSLDTSKIQCNKDVGKSILESYSRVLESLAFNIVARIDDLLHVDELTKQSDKLTTAPGPMSLIAHKKISVPQSSVPVSSTTYTTPSISTSSPASSVVSPRTVKKTPFMNRDVNKPPRHSGGLGAKRVLTNYLVGGNQVQVDGSGTKSSIGSSPLSRDDSENVDPQKISAIHQKSSRF